MISTRSGLCCGKCARWSGECEWTMSLFRGSCQVQRVRGGGGDPTCGVLAAPTRAHAYTPHRPFKGMNKPAFFRRVVDEKMRPPINPKWPAELGALLNDCWHPKLRQRPLCSEVGARLLQLVIEQRCVAARRFRLDSARFASPPPLPLPPNCPQVRKFGARERQVRGGAPGCNLEKEQAAAGQRGRLWHAAGRRRLLMLTARS